MQLESCEYLPNNISSSNGDVNSDVFPKHQTAKQQPCAFLHQYSQPTSLMHDIISNFSLKPQGEVGCYFISKVISWH